MNRKSKMILRKRKIINVLADLKDLIINLSDNIREFIIKTQKYYFLRIYGLTFEINSKCQ